MPKRWPVKVMKCGKKNQRHPSLHFKKLKGGENRFSVRIGDHYRAIGYLTDDTVEWIWIGTHEDYNKLLG